MPLDPPPPDVPPQPRLLPLDALPAACPVLVRVAWPRLADAAAATRAAGLLLAQFQREGRATAAGADVAADGHALIIAWDGGPLSGCAHDRLARLAASLDAGQGSGLAAAPPILIRATDGWQAVDRAGLRRLRAAGRIDAGSLLLDTRVDTLGAWRERGLVPFAGSWAAAIAP